MLVRDGFHCRDVGYQAVQGVSHSQGLMTSVYSARPTTAPSAPASDSMSASIFDDENNQDDGVSIDGHEVGNTGDYTDIGWDFQDSQIGGN